RVYGRVGDADPVGSQRFDEKQALARRPRAQAQDLERAGGYVASEVGGGPSDERARPHVVPVGAVRAEGEPGSDGQRKPVEEFLREPTRAKRGDELVGERGLGKQRVSDDHGVQGLPVDGSGGNPYATFRLPSSYFRVK